MASLVADIGGGFQLKVILAILVDQYQVLVHGDLLCTKFWIRQKLRVNRLW